MVYLFATHLCSIHLKMVSIERTLKPKPHGNLKANSRARHDIKSWESTKKCIRNSSKGLQPRDTVHQVLKEDIREIAACSGVGQMLRERQQVKDLRKSATKTGLVKSLLPGNVTDDPWFRLLGACKKQAAHGKTAFIRDVRVAPEPFCVMTTNRQVNVLKRFCCNPIEFRPFTVDPTFHIGNFNVARITYEHFLLENRRDGTYPSMIGPVLLHEKKAFKWKWQQNFLSSHLKETPKQYIDVYYRIFIFALFGAIF